MASVIGWDIGGAHVKAARVADGVVVAVAQIPCAPHEGVGRLEQAIAECARALGPAPRHAVTMTAELSDAFPTRAVGVASIISMMARAVPGETRFYAGAAGFVTREAARGRAPLIASANWRASAQWIARCCRDALFVDMGSTTTDLVPIQGGEIVARGADDAERLAQGELVYTGLTRGRPQAGLAHAPVDGRWTPLVDEGFATMADVRRILNDAGDVADLSPTADGRGRSVAESMSRLARLVGGDAGAEEGRWRALAAFFARAQMRFIEDAVALQDSRGAPPCVIIGAGAGRRLIARLAAQRERPYRDAGDFIPASPETAGAAASATPACAVALLIDQT